MQGPDTELNCDYVGVVHGGYRMSALSQLVIRRLRRLVLRRVRLNIFYMLFILRASTTRGLTPCPNFQWDRFRELAGHRGGRSSLLERDMGDGIGVTMGGTRVVSQ